MQADDDDEKVRTPEMHTPEQAAEQEILLQDDDGPVGPFGGRVVEQSQGQASRHQQQDEHQRDATQPERVREANGALRHLARPQMKQQRLVEVSAAFRWLVVHRPKNKKGPSGPL